MRAISQAVRMLACAALLALAACATAPRSDPPAGRAPLILVGLDGFRWDILDRYPAPRLHEIAARGVRAQGLVPVMPSKTFPNFYAIATGLYPEHSGVLGNETRDRALGVTFRASSAQDARWWRGEPIWITAEKQGVHAAVLFWVGSEVAVDGVRPWRWSPYDESLPLDARVAQVLSWLDLPPTERPGLIALYFDTIDTASHAHGVDSPEEAQAVAQVDAAVGGILDGLAARGLADAANVVIVGDHGMTDISRDRVVYLDDYFDVDRLESAELEGGRGNAVSVSFQGDPATVEEAYRAFALAHPAMKVYRRGRLPAGYHLGHPTRGPDLLLVPEPGWLLSRRSVPWSETYLATHGYDPGEREMQAGFLAAGPAFADGITVEPFENVDLYPLLARVLGLRPAKSDGRLGEVAGMLEDARP